MSTASNKNCGQFWKYVLIGGVPGIMLGSGGTVVAENVVEKVGKDVVPEKEANAEELTPADVPVANVSDDMPFGEAFAAARAEVGAGGVFSWHGNLYNTFTAEEWEVMSQEERAEFGDRVYGTDFASSTVSDELEVVSSEQEEGVSINEIGVVEMEDGDQMIVAVGTVNGEQIAFADVDCDGNIDVIMDSQGQEVTGVEVTVDQLCELAMENENYPTAAELYADTPDYMNDADTSAFA